MKNLFLIATFILCGTFATQAQEKETFDLTIEISGMDTDKGKVFIAIYDSEKTFLKSGGSTKGAFAVVKNKKATAYFKDLEKGVYAVSLFHDENDNNKMDTKRESIHKRNSNTFIPFLIVKRCGFNLVNFLPKMSVKFIS